MYKHVQWVSLYPHVHVHVLMYTVVMNTIIIVYPTWTIINVFMGYAKLLVMNTVIDLGEEYNFTCSCCTSAAFRVWSLLIVFSLVPRPLLEFINVAHRRKE